ncbi:hypothetical protein [Streptomyces varsoviensis]|uniref:hypothetical protein n=1 Tax=Streptomyces varsoviensis TaxID=67373 RepID=UPI0006621659|nr:hypothetical protein [Streptomyces varsoviensis]
MGFWGYFVVGRSDRGLVECAVFDESRDHLELTEAFADGWQLWQHPPEPELGDIDSLVRGLTKETGAPALAAYVLDSECAVVAAAGPAGTSWSACLGRAAMARYMEQSEMDIGELFLTPRAAASQGAAWAAAAGHIANTTALTRVLAADPDPFVENLFYDLLAELGIEDLADPDAPEQHPGANGGRGSGG